MLSLSRQRFFNSIWPLCINAGKVTGVHPEIIFAQSALETGYGQHAPQNNFFGIKGDGNSLSTTEFVDGVAKSVRSHFAGYSGMADSVAGYTKFILRNKRYRAFRSAPTLAAQLTCLQASGYSTDPQYAEKLSNIILEIPGLEKNYHSLPGLLARATQSPIVKVPAKPDQPKGQAVSDLSVFLKQHASVLNVAAQVINGLVEVSPIPAPLKAVVVDVASALQQHATNTATVASGLATATAPATTGQTPPASTEAGATPAATAPVTLEQALQSIQGTALASALASAQELLPEVINDFANGASFSAGLAEAETDAENEAVKLVGEVAGAVQTEAGLIQPIAKSPTAN